MAPWPQICQIKIRQLPKFSNSPNLTPSKFPAIMVIHYNYNNNYNVYKATITDYKIACN